MGGRINPEKFRKWYFKQVEDMPIISCYCLAMPITGHYQGFLSVTSDNGSPLPTPGIRQNLQEFERIKGWARSFIQQHSVILYSAEAQVEDSITIAKGENVNIEHVNPVRVKGEVSKMLEVETNKGVNIEPVKPLEVETNKGVNIEPKKYNLEGCIQQMPFEIDLAKLENKLSRKKDHVATARQLYNTIVFNLLEQKNNKRKKNQLTP